MLKYPKLYNHVARATLKIFPHVLIMSRKISAPFTGDARLSPCTIIIQDLPIFQALKRALAKQ